MTSLLSQSMHHNSLYFGRLLKNLLKLLEASYHQSLYEVLPRSVQVWVPDLHLGVYPDLMVIAGQPLCHGGYSNQVTNPCLLFEILSEPIPVPGLTVDTLTHYSSLFSRCRTIPYLQEYVFVHQQEARIDQVYRTEEQVWEMVTYSGLDNVVELTISNAYLPLAAIYDQILFERSVEAVAG